MDLNGARWRRSSYSSGGGDDNCVEVAFAQVEWRKSSFSGGTGGGNDSCVEVAFAGPATALRDSKNPGGPVLVLPATAWTALLTAAR